MSKLIKENRKKPPPGEAGDDAALIRSILNGQKRAFDELVLRYQNRVYHLCYRFFGDDNEANDMAQEIFIKVYQSLGSFRFESGFSTWLYRIAVNTCKNRLKSMDFRFKKVLGSLNGKQNPGNDQPVMEIADDSSSPALELEKKESALLVQKAINALSPDKKTVVILRDIQGLSYEEIAGVTGFSMGTVKSKLARARVALRKKLEGAV